MSANGRILCRCNCGSLIDKFDRNGKEHFYKHGHNPKWNKGKKCPQLIGHNARSHSNHFRWKGANVGDRALHEWVSRHYASEKVYCEICKQRTAMCMVNMMAVKNGDRDPDHWKHICISCEKFYHNELNPPTNAIPPDRTCCKCGSSKTKRKLHMTGRGIKEYPIWYVVDKEKNLYQCGKCHKKEAYNY
jgi:hypothetical protein